MKLILFRGRPGVGKTTVSRAFAVREKYPLLSKDDLYDPLITYLPEHSDRNKLSHRLLYQVLEGNVQSDTVIVLDFPFQRDEDFAIIDAWCEEREVSLISILVTCSDEHLWDERLQKRAENPKPNQLITNFAELSRFYGGHMQLTPRPGELLVDSVESVDEMLRQVSAFVEKWN